VGHIFQHGASVMRISSSLALIATVIAFLVAAAPADANTSAVTYVSGTGNDSNTNNFCDRTSPCQSFTAALTVTSPGGVIFCLDSALNVGTVFIAIDVTIDCSETNSAIFGTNNAGVYVNAVAKVTLRGLTIYTDETYQALYGIIVTQGASVHVENCKIFGFTTAGILVEPNAENATLKVQDSTITRNATGIKIVPIGSANVQASIDRTRIDDNFGGGVRVDGTAGGPIKAAITDSSISLNGSNGVNAVSGPAGNVRVNLIRDVIASNVQAGVQSNQSNGGNASVTVSQLMLSSNGSAWSIVGGATLLSYQNNEVTGTTGTPPTPASFQ
jgi:hypothetical protein